MFHRNWTPSVSPTRQRKKTVKVHHPPTETEEAPYHQQQILGSSRRCFILMILYLDQCRNISHRNLGGIIRVWADRRPLFVVAEDFRWLLGAQSGAVLALGARQFLSCSTPLPRFFQLVKMKQRPPRGTPAASPTLKAKSVGHREQLLLFPNAVSVNLFVPSSLLVHQVR